ncbi:hypothetical protein VSR68_32765 [Paraburkholderia phymatum]|uniref:hypothetical protein n=1 Tax=Paraburkholderia phymatum TaxID=148447 RepID=UPI00316B7BF0
MEDATYHLAASSQSVRHSVRRAIHERHELRSFNPTSAHEIPDTSNAGLLRTPLLEIANAFPHSAKAQCRNDFLAMRVSTHQDHKRAHNQEHDEQSKEQAQLHTNPEFRRRKQLAPQAQLAKRDDEVDQQGNRPCRRQP